MNPSLLIQAGSVDPDASPLTVNELFALLDTVLSGEIVGSYTPYVLGATTPSVEDQDKAWIELDSGGRPLSIKTFYGGAWRRVYNGMIGEIRAFSGDPTNRTYWDEHGRGQVGQRYDGWQICNGENGSPNLTDKFLLGAHMDNSAQKDGYSGGWQAVLTGPDGVANSYKTGGHFTETIANDNLPLLTNAQEGDAPGLWIYGKEAKEGHPHPGNKAPLVDVNFGADAPHQWNLTDPSTGGHVYGKDPPTPIWTVDPFVAVGFITFIGYA